MESKAAALTLFIYNNDMSGCIISKKTGGINMRNQSGVSPVEKKKVVLITVLFSISAIIVLSGVFFIVFSLVNHISFTVMSSKIHGAVFGLLVAYFGVRNFLSVKKLRTEVYKNSSQFSWSNFRKNAPRQLQPRNR
jgi:hypothetical protein